MDDYISAGALGYARAVVSRIKLEMLSRALPEGKARIVVMLIEPVVQKVIEWMNQVINLNDENRELITESEFYRFIPVIYFSHNSGC